MTNQDKAREIELNVYAFGEKPKGEFQAPAYRAALEMAEWKDEQFKEFLEKKVNNAIDIYNNPASNKTYWNGKVIAFREIIDELFGE